MANGTPSLEIEFGKHPIKLVGREAFLWALVFTCLTGVGYLVFYVLGAWGAPVNLASKWDAHEAMMKEQHSTFVQTNNELIYVLSVCLNQRMTLQCEKLNLAMPDSLRAKLR